MFTATLFTRYQFNTPDKAFTLFELLNQADSLFVPVKYDAKEAARKVYQPHDLNDPVRLLSGVPSYRSGSIFLKGKGFKLLLWIRWSESKISAWHIYLDDKFFNTSDRIEKFVHFMSTLCTTFPILYGGAASQDDWEAKHWLVTEHESGGTSHAKVGLDLQHCLPGVYWLTWFSESLVTHFSKEQIQRVPSYQIVDPQTGGLLLRLREHPFHPELLERLRHDNHIIEILGKHYFFDIREPKKSCTSVPGIIEGNELAYEVSKKGTEHFETEEVQDFEQQVVYNPHGERYTEPDAIAEMLVVFLHTEVQEVFSYTPLSLEALDRFFARKPQQYVYSRDHLMKEFIPALGAYFGEVLIRTFQGQWNVRNPLLTSTVVINGKEFTPFRDAYRVIYGKSRLGDIYNSIAHIIK